jgi:hypothetical protein
MTSELAVLTEDLTKQRLTPEVRDGLLSAFRDWNV